MTSFIIPFYDLLGGMSKILRNTLDTSFGQIGGEGVDTVLGALCHEVEAFLPGAIEVCRVDMKQGEHHAIFDLFVVNGENVLSYNSKKYRLAGNSLQEAIDQEGRSRFIYKKNGPITIEKSFYPAREVELHDTQKRVAGLFTPFLDKHLSPLRANWEAHRLAQTTDRVVQPSSKMRF